MAESRLTCPECEATFKPANPVAPGKKIRCPKCKETFVVADEDANDARRKAKKKPQKSNMPLILGMVGCGGLLLLTCLGAVGGGVWYWTKSEPTKVAQQKDAKADAAKDKPGGDKGNAQGSKLKKNYDEIQMGMKFDAVVALMGNRGGATAPSVFPELTDQKADKKLVSDTMDHRVNLYFEWVDNTLNDRLIVGYDQDVVAFKGYFQASGGANTAEYQFDPAKARKKKKK
jgi:hypothetical protein